MAFFRVEVDRAKEYIVKKGILQNGYSIGASRYTENQTGTVAGTITQITGFIQYLKTLGVNWNNCAGSMYVVDSVHLNAGDKVYVKAKWNSPSSFGSGNIYSVIAKTNPASATFTTESSQTLAKGTIPETEIIHTITADGDYYIVPYSGRMYASSGTPTLEFDVEDIYIKRANSL